MKRAYNPATMDLPIVAKIIKRDGLPKNLIQWTHEGAELLDGAALVTLEDASKGITFARADGKLTAAKEYGDLLSTLAQLREVRASLAAGFPAPISEPLPEVTSEEDDTVSREMTPFDLPEIVMKKVELEEVIVLLKAHLSTRVMPTASNNSEWLSNHEWSYKTIGSKPWPEPPNGWYSETSYIELTSFGDGIEAYHKGHSIPSDEKSYFALLHFQTLDVLVNLSTLEAVVRQRDGNDKLYRWFEWHSGTKLAIDRVQFARIDSDYF